MLNICIDPPSPEKKEKKNDKLSSLGGQVLDNL